MSAPWGHKGASRRHPLHPSGQESSIVFLNPEAFEQTSDEKLPALRKMHGQPILIVMGREFTAQIRGWRIIWGFREFSLQSPLM